MGRYNALVFEEMHEEWRAPPTKKGQPLPGSAIAKQHRYWIDVVHIVFLHADRQVYLTKLLGTTPHYTVVAGKVENIVGTCYRHRLQAQALQTC